MSHLDELTDVADGESTLREYVLGVRIVEFTPDGEDSLQYRFEAPHHKGTVFKDSDLAELYADVYFDVNGFEEAGTGNRGIPPEIIQAGRDTLVAYFLTQPETDVNWIASFYGTKPEKIRRYVSRVHKRAEGIRKGARERGIE